MKVYRLLYIVLVASVLSFFFACGTPSKPQDVMSEDEMVALLHDMYVVEGYYAEETQYRFEKMPNEIAESYAELFEKHRIEMKDYEQSMAYYVKHPELLSAIQQRVLDQLTEEENNISTE